jgi:hypothetical protein
MRNIIYLKRTFIALFVLIAAFSSCRKETEGPISDVSKDIEANSSITELISKYSSSMPNGGILTINDGIIIKGIVTSSDSTGNHYKSIFIQDDNGAIIVKINTTGTYLDYPIGTEIGVKVMGLEMDNYADMIQIGSSYDDNGTLKLGGIDPDKLSDYIIKGKEKSTPTPFVLDLANIPSDISSKLGYWTEVKSVMFSDEDKDKTYANAVDKKTENRTLTDANGNTIIVRTSGYASFADEQLPLKQGSIKAILSSFNGTLQLILNTPEDINFTEDRFKDPNAGEPASGSGTLTDPYNLTAAKENQGATGEFWVKGFIVGSLVDFNYEFNNTTSATTNMMIGANSDETNQDKVLTVQLPSGFIRESLNLVNNSDNYKKEIWLKGTLESYFSVPGIKSVTSYSWDGINEEVDNTPTTGVIGAGTPILGSDLTNTSIDFNTYNELQSEAIWTKGTGNAYVNAYNKDDSKSWLISQNMVDFDAVSNSALVVDEKVSYFTTLEDVKALYSTDYSGSGDPTTATWTEFTYDNSINGDRTGGDLTAIYNGISGSAYIAFKYTGLTSAGNVCSWDISSVQVLDKTTISPDAGMPTTIQNGDFEGTWTDDNTPDGWEKAESITKESTIVHGGSFSAKQVGGTKDLAQTIAAEAGATYEVTFWYYIESGDGTDGRLWSFFKDATGTSIGDIKDVNDYLQGANGQWHEYKADYTAPANTAQIYFELRTYGSAVVYYDDISITKK